MIKMKKWMEQFRVEDWVVVWVSIPLLVLAAVAPSALPKVPATLLGGAAWSNIACLFAIVLVVLYAGCLMLRRPLRGLLASLVVVFAVSLLAQIVAKIPSRVVLRLRIGILFGALRVTDPQRVACSRVAETRDPG